MFTLDFSLGIYRGNKFGIRPTIYSSAKEVLPNGDFEFKVQNVAEEEWHYRSERFLSFFLFKYW